MRQPIVILISASVATASFIGWRVHVMRHQTVNHFEVEYDPSKSFTGGCQALVGSAEEVFHARGASMDSTLTVLALGDASTANEPRRIATDSFAIDQKAIEGRRAGAERREQLLQDLWAQCHSLRPTLVTPVYLGVQQAIAGLHAKGCKAGSRCSLWVATDLEENGERGIEARLRGSRNVDDPLPPTLNNEGIQVTFCGYAQTAGRVVGPSGREIGKVEPRGPNRDARLQSIWRSLFTQPQLVTFEPYCPQPSVPVARKTTGAGTLLEATK